MKTKRNIVLFTLALLVLFTLGMAWLYQNHEPEVPAYTEVAVKRADIVARVSATGTLNPLNSVQVGSQVSGAIAELHADFNQQVKKGQLIARIDPAVFQARLAEAQATLSSAQAGAGKARVALADAKRQLDRQENLFKKKLIAASARDAAKLSHDSALVEYEVAKAAVAQAEAVLQREQVNLDYTRILAPIDGVVISRDVDVGQTVAASLQAPTLFTIAQDLTRMQVETEVDEAFIGKIAEGQSVSFGVFAYPGRTFEGRVAQVRLQPRTESGVVRYSCIIEVDNPDLALKPGMTATVSIRVAHKPQVLQVPASALRYVPDWPQDKLDALRDQLDAQQRLVWILENGEPTPLQVITGVEGDRYVEVIAEDLREGMQVLLPDKRKPAEQRRFGLSLF